MLNFIDGTINVLLVTFCYKKQGVNHPLQKSSQMLNIHLS